MTYIPRRTVLYLPASNRRAIEKARTLPCDAVILDLEDAVSAEEKDRARSQALAAVGEGGFGAREVIVRINALETPWGKDDCAAFAQSAANAILLPKIGSAPDLCRYDERLDSEGPAIWAMIETARSIFHIDEIASYSGGNRLQCLVVGTNDLAREGAMKIGAGRFQLIGILSLIVMAARAYGLTVLDGVFNSLDDDPGFLDECRQTRALGFDGKTLIHPKQIAPCNGVFTPDATEISAAQRLIELFEQPENREKGAVRFDGRMVERLHVEEARRILAQAQLP